MIKNEVGCVVLNYNDSETTLNLLSTIKDYEVLSYIVIVDNCSTDNSFQVLKKYETEKIIVVSTIRNGGYGYGNNFGVNYLLENFGIKLVLIANPDVLFEENLIIKFKEYILQTDAAVISSRRKGNDGKEQKPSFWKVPTAFSYWIKSFIFVSNFLKLFSKEKTESYLLNVECVAGSLLLINVDYFLDVGGYDENLFLYGEETLLGYKLKKQEYKSFILNEFYFHYHSKTISKSISRRRQTKQILKSRLYIIQNYYLKRKASKAIYQIMFKLVLIEMAIVNFLKFPFKKYKDPK